MVDQQKHFTVMIVVIMAAGAAKRVKILHKKNRWSLGHIAHLKKQLKSTNNYDDQEKQKLIIFFLRIEWFLI